MRRYVLIVITVAAVLAGCTQHDVGILEGIELERQIVDDGDLSNELPIRAITTVPGYVMVAAGDLYIRTDAESDGEGNDPPLTWAEISSPASETVPFQTNALVRYNGVAYAAYTNLIGDRSAFYPVDLSSADDDSLGSTVTLGDAVRTHEDSWGSHGPGMVERLMVSSTGSTEVLFVVVRPGDDTYRLFATTGPLTEGSEFFEVPVPDSLLGAPVRDVAYDGDRYWFLTGAGIFTSVDLASAAIHEPDEGPTGEYALVAIHYGGLTGGDQLWVSAKDREDGYGLLFSAEDGNAAIGETWSSHAEPYTASLGGNELVFTDFVTVERDGEPELLVGCESVGYRILGADATVGPVSPLVGGSNFDASGLSQATVLSFHLSPGRTDVPVPTGEDDQFELNDGDLLFAGTATLGLWKALFFSDPEQWQRE